MQSVLGTIAAEYIRNPTTGNRRALRLAIEAASDRHKELSDALEGMIHAFIRLHPSSEPRRGRSNGT